MFSQYTYSEMQFWNQNTFVPFDIIAKLFDIIATSFDLPPLLPSLKPGSSVTPGL